MGTHCSPFADTSLQLDAFGGCCEIKQFGGWNMEQEMKMVVVSLILRFEELQIPKKV